MKFKKVYRLTKDIFLKRSELVHGVGKYKYISVPDELKAGTYINIKCNKCEHTFEQKVYSHINNENGCPKCSYAYRANKKLIKEDKALKRVKNKFPHLDFQLAENYKGQYTKLKITCQLHGDTHRNIKSLLKKENTYGCVKCGHKAKNADRTLTTEDFVSKAKKIHPLYSYDKVNYINYDTKVTITCPEHGEFNITPHALLNGQKCKYCNASNPEKLINKLLKEYGIKYEFQHRVTINGTHYYQDFYLVNDNVFLEYHGGQHYITKPNGYFTASYLKRGKFNDKLKEDNAKEKGMSYYIISYKEDIVTALSNFLRRHYPYYCDGKLYHNIRELIDVIKFKDNESRDKHLSVINNSNYDRIEIKQVLNILTIKYINADKAYAVTSKVKNKNIEIF